MSEEPEVEIQTGSENVVLLDKNYYYNLIRMLRNEIESKDDPQKGAVMCFEIGRIFEEHLKDLFQASAHYQESLSLCDNFIPALRALRRIALVRGNWSNFLSLTDHEIRITEDSLRRAQLWIERAEVLFHQLGAWEEALIAIHKALELDHDNIKGLWLLEGILKERKDYPGLVDTLKKLAGLMESSNLGSALLYEAGTIKEVFLDDTDGAIEIYEEVLKKDDSFTPAIHALTRLYYRKKMFNPLIKILKKKAEGTSGRKKARILYSIGRILHERLSDISGAIEVLDEAFKADPESELIIGEMVRLCQLVGQYEKLAYYYEKQAGICKSADERSAIYMRLGQLYEENLQNDEKASEYYLKAIEENPKYLPAFVQLASFYKKRNQTDNIVAMHIKEAEITESPMRRAMAYHRAGEIRESQGKVEEAIELYNKAVALVPSFTLSFNAMERLLEKTGNYQRLVLLYQERLITEENPAVKISLMHKIARMLEERLNNREGAYGVYKDILEIDPANSNALSALVRISAEHELWEEHVTYLLKEADILSDDEQIVDILQRVGEIYEQYLKNLEKAIDSYKRLLSISPFYPHAIRNLGRIYYKLGKFEELVELHRTELGVATEPEERSLLFYRIGSIYENNLRNMEEAISSYRNALVENPRNMAASWALYKIFRKNGDWMSIIEILENEASYLPEGHQRALALVRIGELWEDLLGRSDMASDSFSQALRMEPGLSEARESLVRLCEQDGNFEYLAQLLHQEYMTSVDPDDQYRLALILGELWLMRLKNPKEASDWFMKALTCKPDSVVSLRNLDLSFRTMGEWKSIIEVLRKLMDLLPDGNLRIALLNELSMIENRLGSSRLIETRGEAEKFVDDIIQQSSNDQFLYDIILERLIEKEKNIDAYITMLEVRENMQKEDSKIRAVYEYVIGESLLTKAQIEEAIEKFERACNLDPSNIVPLLFLEEVAYQIGDTERYANVASKLLERTLKPESRAKILCRMGLMNLESGKREEGIGNLIEALRQNPENEEVFNNLIRVMGGEGRWQELVAILEEVEDKVSSPNRIPEFFSLLGNLQWKHIGDYSKAIRSFNKVLKVDPQKIPALLGLLDLYIAKDEVNEAIAISRYILNNISDSGAYLTTALRMADLVEKSSMEHDEIIGILENILVQNPNHIEVMEKLHQLYKKAGEWEKAIEVMEKIADREEGDKKTDCLLEEVKIYEEKMKMPEKAIETLDRILSLHPYHRDAVMMKTSIYKKMGNFRKAVEMGDEIIRHFRKGELFDDKLRVDVLLDMAEIEKTKFGNPKVSFDYLKEAFEVEPENYRVGCLLLENVKSLKGEKNEYTEIIEKVINAQPFNIDMLLSALTMLGEVDNEERGMVISNFLYSVAQDRVTDKIKQLSEKYRKETDISAHGKLAETDFESIRIDSIAHPVRKLLDEVSKYAGKIFGKEYSYYGISKSENLLKREDPRGAILVRECRKAAEFLGVKDFEVYLIPVSGNDPIIEIFDNPAILFPSSFVELSDQEQGIMATISLSQIALNNFIPFKMNVADFESFLIALGRKIRPGFGSGFSMLKKVEAMEGIIEDAIPKGKMKPIEKILKEYVEAPWFDIEEWYFKIKATSLRLALLRCGDIGAVLDMLKKREPDLVGIPASNPEGICNAFSKNEFTKEVARFVLSRAYVDLWRKYLKRQ